MRVSARVFCRISQFFEIALHNFRGTFVVWAQASVFDKLEGNHLHEIH